jgi:signal transduction histidine kinase
VIVLDLSMPTMDGLEALPRLREAAPGATIAVLSGLDRSRLAASASDLGADAYFEKGTPPSVVLTRLKSLLGIDTPTPTTAPSAGVTQLADRELRAAIAHDLRSPLTAVIGFGETLDDRWDDVDDGRRRSLVRRMTWQARMVHAITENLVTSSALEAGTVAVDVEPVSPSVLVLDEGELVRPLCGDHPLDVRAAPDLPPVLVDRSRFHHVIANVVLNAQAHAPPGTTIGLSARADWPWVAVDVDDEGPGIPAPDRVRVLERHVRLARDSKGLGLGLFVASALARAMGGSLFVTESARGGTRVVCRLRVAEGEG